ncbi:MAG: hypothetical protein B6244_04770 [Candidatus Cloacimonetes bacterium 4572_55]|nr:MAG: hypothetical protein B6244_04770 [Candidatus Cloacimonetes bacterium 4572_55]
MKEILLVDDDRLFLKSMGRALNAEGYNVDLSGTGQDALSKIKTKQYDLIILDYKMKPMDGLEVVKRIREQNYRCPIIMISAFGSIDMATTAFSHDVVTVLPKPVEIQRLKSVVKNTIREYVSKTKRLIPRRPIKPLERRVPQTPTRPQKQVGKAPDKKNVLVVDDSPTYRKMMIRTVSVAFDYFNFIEAENGVDAIEKMNQFDIKLILLDINMPHMNGFDFMKLKRKSTRFKKIPVIVLTTEKEKETMGKAYLSGATVFMKKPFQRQELIKVVKTMVFWHMK